MKKVILIAFLSLSIALAIEPKEANVTKFKANLQLDPVYKLDIKKYPKFATKMVLKSGKVINFISVKSMLNYYYHPEKYPGFGAKSKLDVKEMFVKDYLDGKELNLKDAWYIFGSKLSGPHGDDLIPVSSKVKAKLFEEKYGGTKIMDFKEIGNKGFGLIKYLDM
jgi:nitrous oxide reductase accessory protein NosL